MLTDKYQTFFKGSDICGIEMREMIREVIHTVVEFNMISEQKDRNAIGLGTLSCRIY